MNTLGILILFITVLSFLVLDVALIRRLTDKKLYYPYSFLISFAILFTARMSIKTYVIFHPELINYDVIRYTLMLLYITGISMLFLFFSTIRYQTDKILHKTFKVLMKMGMIFFPFVLILLVSHMGRSPQIEVEPWTPGFFQLMYKSPSHDGNTIFMFFYSIQFFFGLFFLNGVLNSHVKPLLKLVYVMLLMSVLIVLMITGISSIGLDHPSIFQVLSKEILQFATVVCASVHFWREGEFI